MYETWIMYNYALPEGDLKGVETGWICNILIVNYIS
jgi:hypothetical protein